jgi:CheY-like chemotaxis protein
MKHYILMLEHDPDDRHIIQHFFQERNYPVSIDFVQDSDQLLACLASCGSGRAFPSLILMNVSSGPLGGAELVRRLKSDPAVAPIPVVVLSGNKDPEKTRACYSAGAASFAVKPDLYQATDEKIANFFNYWFKTVELAGI